MLPTLRWTATRCSGPWPPTPHLRDIPVVMMSSVEEVDSVARCIEMGAEDYLFKPVNPVILKARVGASLEKKRLRDQQRELIRKFATAEVADELLTTGLSLGGKHVEASVMFSDIRSFTSISEACPTPTTGTAPSARPSTCSI
jgi:adenylate cyclase